MHRVSFSLLALFLSVTAFAGKAVNKVEFVYRDPTETRLEGKLVQVQGLRDGSASLSALCSKAGEACDCLYLRSAFDRKPLRSPVVGMSETFNVAYCSLDAGNENTSAFNFLLLRNRQTKAVTDLQPIRTALTLEDVLGKSLSSNKVAAIFQYSCTRTFFEGEGVNTGNISCVANQRLGVISADYSFYAMRAGDGSFVSGTGDVAFSGSICNRNSFLKYQCTNSAPQLKYGFYKEAVAPFFVGIWMTRGPELAGNDNTPLSQLYGYASMPDSAGNCAPGLMRVRQWMAQPASILHGSLGNNPPSSFINSNNNLNNTVVEAVQPSNFLVSRQPNTLPCSGSGDCSQAMFGGNEVAVSAAYIPVNPSICVIPPALLSAFRQ